LLVSSVPSIRSRATPSTSRRASNFNQRSYRFKNGNFDLSMSANGTKRTFSRSRREVWFRPKSRLPNRRVECPLMTQSRRPTECPEIGIQFNCECEGAHHGSGVSYQIATLLSGGIYILSPGLTSNAEYHASTFGTMPSTRNCRGVWGLLTNRCLSSSSRNFPSRTARMRGRSAAHPYIRQSPEPARPAGEVIGIECDR
jgi:hypothetical protein